MKTLGKIIDYGINPIVVVCTAIAIVVINVLHSFNILIHGTPLFNILFYGSLSILLVQVLFSQHKTSTKADEIERKSGATSENTNKIMIEAVSLKTAVSTIDSKANALLSEAANLKKLQLF